MRPRIYIWSYEPRVCIEGSRERRDQIGPQVAVRSNSQRGHKTTRTGRGAK